MAAISAYLPHNQRSLQQRPSPTILPVADAHEIRKQGTAKTRTGRFSERNRIYHISTTTHCREPLFLSLENGRKVVQALMCEEQRGHSTTLAFVVMPDHLHWLLQLKGNHSISDSVCVVKSRSARHINAITGRKKTIWQRGFYDRAIRKDEDLVTIARYIVANPLRAGLVDSIERYSLWDAVWV